MFDLSITIMPNMAIAWPFLPYIFLMLFFNMSMASSKGITSQPENDN